MDRRIGGEVREFGISGLLYKSNVLLYDRQENDSKESLWTQVGLRAVTGPAARKKLTMKLLPSQLLSWKKWKKHHSDTKVLSRETGYQRNYNRNPYKSYFSSNRTMFPVRQKHDVDRYQKKDMVVLVRINETWKAYPVKEVKKAVGNTSSFQDTVSGRTIRLRLTDQKNVSVEYANEKGSPPVSYLFWFSFSATYPEVDVFTAE